MPILRSLAAGVICIAGVAARLIVSELPLRTAIAVFPP